jgi:hypothetical protein
VQGAAVYGAVSGGLVLLSLWLNKRRRAPHSDRP